MHPRRVRILPDLEQACREACWEFLHLGREAIRQRGRFVVALAGGSTPRRLYEMLAGPGASNWLDWSRVHVLFGDERGVPGDHPDSNARMAHEALLNHVPIPTAQVHPMPAHEADGDAAAARYERIVREAVGEPAAAAGGTTIPVLDLVLLGLGDDGHVASLFPGTAALRETRRLVAVHDVPQLASARPSLPGFARRMTLTFPVINRARQVIFLAAGPNKADAVGRVFAGTGEDPALGINPAESGALWCLDAAAAARLPSTGRGALAETEIVGRGLGRTRMAPSILAADFGRLAEQVAEVERCGADRIHADVMDGHFVPNISFGPLVVKALRPRTPLPLECHLMIEEPERYVDAFAQAGAASIQVHVEQQPRTSATLERIRGLRLQTGLVVNPGTPASAALPLLSEATTLLVMSVQPGFGGQAFLPSVLPKVRALRDAIDAVHPGCELEIDGGIDPTTAGEAVLHGARVLVAGSSVFHEKAPPEETLARLREGIP